MITVPRSVRVAARYVPVVIAVLMTGCGGGGGESLPPTMDKVVFTPYSSDTREIYIMDTNGSRKRRLTSNPADDFGPVLSPDRKQIVFVSNREGGQFLFEMQADGSNVRRLTNIGPNSDPAISPDGSKIAFVSHQDGNDEIYVMNRDGSNPVRLTNSPGPDASPTWTPDGRHIVFTSEPADGSGGSLVYIMDADGQNVTRLTNGAGPTATFTCFDFKPSVSPDGKFIVFDSNRGEGFRSIMRVPITGGESEQITHGGINSCPRYSFDGRSIFFISTRATGGAWQIFRMDADGSNVVNLTPNDAEYHTGLDSR